jgi:tRNA threonylcarbamoyladenosine biosynthesis protein TsaE
MMFISHSESDNYAIAVQILAAFPMTKIFCLYGNLGAGKTTFTKSFCEVLGVKETVTSPTFALVNEYQGAKNTIYHFDFYRIKSEEEAYDMGYEEYFFSDAYCFIEWGEKIPNLIPDDAVAIYIEAQGANERQITLKTDN